MDDIWAFENEFSLWDRFFIHIRWFSFYEIWGSYEICPKTYIKSSLMISSIQFHMILQYTFIWFDRLCQNLSLQFWRKISLYIRAYLQKKCDKKLLNYSHHSIKTQLFLPNEVKIPSSWKRVWNIFWKIKKMNQSYQDNPRIGW